MALSNDGEGMTVKDFDDFRYPSRKPWLLLLVLAGIVVFWMVKRGYIGSKVPVAAEAVVGTEEDEPANLPATTPAGGPSVRNNRAAAAIVTVPKEAGALLTQAKALETRGNDDVVVLEQARNHYYSLLAMALPPPTLKEVESRLGQLNVRLALSPSPMAEKIEYIVRSGDSIEKISRRMGTTVEALSQGNMVLNANLIKAGDRFRILKGEFSVLASKSRRDLILSLNGRFFKRYAVGTGKFDSTPVGMFLVADRIVHPSWWPQGGREVPYGHPENILGTRWMGLKATGQTPPIKGYGIHGTWFPESIGKAESAGCIRMRNEEVEELFNLIPVGTRVTIEP